MAGVTIRTFLVDGTPEGLRTYEISNSTVHATAFPRPSLDRFLKRDPAGRPGVYILVGQDSDSDRLRAYIGEGDPTEPRLRAHGSKKDFWTQAIVFTSKDDYLTKTQVQYLEAKLVAEARAAGRVVLDNGNIPTEPRISEAERADVEGFLAQVRVLLGAAGFELLKTREAVQGAAEATASAGETYIYRIREAEARMVRTATAYTILTGSTALMELRPSAAPWVIRLREELTTSRILLPGPSGLLRFSKDAEFDSASAAASAVAGGGINGPVNFKRVSDGRTLREVEDAETGLGQAPSTSVN